MKTLKKIVTIIAIMVLIVGLFAWYIGYFNNIKIEEKKEGGYTVIGMEFTGPYSQAGKFMVDVDKKLKDAGIEYTTGFGIYYDDPKIVPAEKCRSFVGGILGKKYLNKITDLKASGFKVDSIPLAEAVVAEFPIKNSLSYMIGPMKVYPAISKYMKKNKYETTLSLEIYDEPHKKVTYIMQYK